MIIMIAAALAAAQPAVAQTTPVPAPHLQMGQAGPKKKECCCKDMAKMDHSAHKMSQPGGKSAQTDPHQNHQQ